MSHPHSHELINLLKVHQPSALNCHTPALGPTFGNFAFTRLSTVDSLSKRMHCFRVFQHVPMVGSLPTTWFHKLEIPKSHVTFAQRERSRLAFRTHTS